MNASLRSLRARLSPRGGAELLAFLALSAAAAGLAGAARHAPGAPFRPYLGELDPAGVTAVAGALGAAVLVALRARGFAIFRGGRAGGLSSAAGLAALFGAVIVLADLVIVFPADLNVAFPASLLFYPAIAFVVEIVFHVLPLGLFIAVLTTAFPGAGPARTHRIAVLAVALLEPALQAALSAASGQPAWIVGFVTVHVFLINLAQLLVFRRHDFSSMYALRLFYYLIWHIAWGHVRLGVLFPR